MRVCQHCVYTRDHLGSIRSSHIRSSHVMLPGRLHYAAACPAAGDTWRAFQGTSYRLGAGSEVLTFPPSSASVVVAASVPPRPVPVSSVPDGYDFEDFFIETELEGMKDVAAAWLRDLPNHRFVETSRQGVEEFVSDIDAIISRRELTAYVLSDVVGMFAARWAALLHAGAPLMRIAKRARAKKASSTNESSSAEECN
jgi:hypothetical protein